jgi:DNA polymerase III sliding clamp (beta) subunit (PCNA family)
METKSMLKALTPHVSNRNPVTKSRSLVLIDPKTQSLNVSSSAFYYLETKMEASATEVAEVKKAFSVNLQVLIRILRLCGEVFNLECSKDSSQAVIISGPDKYYIDVEIASEYIKGKLPNYDDLSDPTISISMPYYDFWRLIQKSEPFASRDKYRQVLCSVCVRQYKDRIRFLATDGRVVSDFSHIEEQADFKATTNEEQGYNEIVVPIEVIKMLPFSSYSGGILLIKKENECRIKSPNLHLVWGLGERRDNYLNVDKAFTGCKPKQLIMCVPTKDVLRAVVGTSSVFRQDNNRTIMSLTAEWDSENEVVFQSKQDSNTVGYYETRIPFTIEHLTNKQTYGDVVHFNGHFLRKIAKSIESKNMSIVLHGNKEPIVIYPADNPNIFTRYLMMPLRGQ